MACSTLKRSYPLPDQISPLKGVPNVKRARLSGGTSARILCHVRASLDDSPFAQGKREHKTEADELLERIVSEAAESKKARFTAGLRSAEEKQPLFTFGETQLICERMLREQEDRLRSEYDKILRDRMTDQYNQFVTFTFDQIQKQAASSAQSSYFS